jgi:hypothetical protein
MCIEKRRYLYGKTTCVKYVGYISAICALKAESMIRLFQWQCTNLVLLNLDAFDLEQVWQLCTHSLDPTKSMADRIR